jgi:hypothetical protein
MSRLSIPHGAPRIRISVPGGLTPAASMLSIPHA